MRNEFELPEDSLIAFWEQRQKRKQRVKEQDIEKASLVSEVAELRNRLIRYEREISELKSMISGKQNAIFLETGQLLMGPESIASLMAACKLHDRTSEYVSQIVSMREKYLCNYFEATFDPEFNEELALRWAKRALKSKSIFGGTADVIQGIIQKLGTSDYSRLTNVELASKIRSRVLSDDNIHSMEVHRYIRSALIGTQHKRPYVPVSVLPNIGFTLTKCAIAPTIPWGDLDVPKHDMWLEVPPSTPKVSKR